MIRQESVPTRVNPGDDRLRIALLAPPMLTVPPPMYAGTERVVATLADELLARGHDVTLFAPGDSRFEGELVASTREELIAFVKDALSALVHFTTGAITREA